MTISYSSDPSYANAKLSGSLVRLNNFPVIVQEVYPEDGEVDYSTPRGQRGNCHITDLDLEPVPLGYVNHSTGCSFTSRIPARHWRQGLRDGLIFVKGRTSQRISITSPSLTSTIMNIYPSMISCFEAIINGEAIERAFSRDFALQSSRGNFCHLLYQSWNVGRVDYVEGGYTTTLNDGYEYLQELYQEQSNANNT